ncbi:hypothetical protein V8G54_029193 [Vigna mungo]|uniref:Uncharacterized protein n=1 Tax=Vigna mungo TaxID=3915 RepID=A0AAQ3MTR9_VIGMU
MKWFKRGLREVDRGLKGREALRVYQGEILTKEHVEKIVVAQHSPNPSIETMFSAPSLPLMEQIQHLKSGKIIKLPQLEPSVKEKAKRLKSSLIEKQKPEDQSNSNERLVIKKLKKRAASLNKRKKMISQTVAQEPTSKKQKVVIKRISWTIIGVRHLVILLFCVVNMCIGSRHSSSKGHGTYGSTYNKLDIKKAFKQIQKKLDVLTNKMDKAFKLKGQQE